MFLGRFFIILDPCFDESSERCFETIHYINMRHILITYAWYPTLYQVCLILSQKSVLGKEQKLTAQLQKIHENLEYLHKVYQFFYDAENLRDLLSDKFKIASSEGYGKDLEHWQVSIVVWNFVYILITSLVELLHHPNTSVSK